MIPGSGYEWLLPIVVSGGGGFVMGFIVGYALKKFLKLAMIILGLFLALLLLLCYMGIVMVDYEKLMSLIATLLDNLKEGAGKFVNWATVNIPFWGCFSVGALLGIKVG
ncbi:MAG: hypothetical protein DRJ49_00285 [Thermoprotei archaeon]|nr:MAG: hypothetical protein DRN53_03640 [Thermoprotei archaeon]RLE90252.1 MAG: hypothetical protein DRJ49_00285 [Thermoprotei archaeon]